MTFLKQLLMAACGLSFGLLSSAGVFTVLASVGLIPRFTGKMHLAGKTFTLENAVVLGTIAGGLASVYEEGLGALGLEGQELGGAWLLLKGAGVLFLIAFGFFAGIFIGCLAFAIAEMLDSIPIFARRTGFRHGLGAAVTAAAFGKLLGSLLYFAKGIFETQS